MVSKVGGGGWGRGCVCCLKLVMIVGNYMATILLGMEPPCANPPNPYRGRGTQSHPDQLGFYIDP